MPATLKSTNAKVRDHIGVRMILDRYELDGVEIEVKEENSKWTLEMSFHDDDLESWTFPHAVKIEDMPSPAEYANDEDFFEAQENVLDEQGEKGFRDLLSELAAYLESPLSILVAIATPLDGCIYGAQVLRVEPGAKEVESLEV